MGHLSNPVGLRLGIIRSWPVKGPSSYFNVELTTFFSQLFRKIFWRKQFHKRGILWGHSIVTFGSNNKLIVKLFMYDGKLEDKFLTFRRRKHYRGYILKRKKVAPRFRYNRRFIHRYNRYRRVFSTKGRTKHKLYVSSLKGDYALIRGLLMLKILKFVKTRMRKLLRLFKYLFLRLSWGIFKQNLLPKLKLKIIPMSTSQASALCIARLSMRKLQSKNSLNAIFFPLLRGYKYFFQGFRVYCRGRFTRRQRSSFRIYKMGKIPLNTLSRQIDYAFVSMPFKYGVGSLKIWITKHKYGRPVYYI